MSPNLKTKIRRGAF